MFIMVVFVCGTSLSISAAVAPPFLWRIVTLAEPTGGALNLKPLRLFVADRVGPFFERILRERMDLVLALHVIGSAVTEDFDPERSDINSLVVLRDMDLDFLDLLGSLCREFDDARLGPPMLITPKYIERWRDVSPVELLDVKKINVLVFGTDLVSCVEVDRSLVRLQCKRELRDRLIHLSWGYVRAAGNKQALTELLLESVVGLASLMRGILYARGEEPPITAGPLFDALSSLVGGQALSFKEVYWMKLRETKMPLSRVRATLKDYYRAIEALIDVVDHLAPAEPKAPDIASPPAGDAPTGGRV